MNFLPQDLEDIIIDYKFQMEHREKFQTSLDKINNINFMIDLSGNTWRTNDNVTTQYYIHVNGLYIHKYTGLELENEVIRVILNII